MDKRQFFRFGFKTMIASLAGIMVGMKSTISRASYPAPAFRTQVVDDILMELFETADVGEDGSIRIQAPLEAEHHAYVPFRISAPGAEKIAVLIDNNPQPLVMSMDVGKNADGELMGTLQLQSTSSISCYALKQGQLYHASRQVRISESGYEE